MGDKLPGCRGPGVKRCEIFRVERRKKTVGVDPDADAFDKNPAIHRDARIQVRAEDAIVFGIHAAQIHAHARHAADAVGQQDEIGDENEDEDDGEGDRKRIAAETRGEVVAQRSKISSASTAIWRGGKQAT